jgi:hypothetical protein
MSVVIVLKGIVLFKRGTIADKQVLSCLHSGAVFGSFDKMLVHRTTTRCHSPALQKFNAWLDSKLKGSHVPGLLVYPEGE